MNCSNSCNKIVRVFGACPSKELFVNGKITIEDIFEIFMVAVSMTPYILVFSLCFLMLFVRTTRLAFIVMMLFIEYFIIIILKDALKDPRPNFECNGEYGNPSNHACFYTSISVWFIMERIFLEKKYRFHLGSVIALAYINYPFVIYSRYHLGYHFVRQIIWGAALGALIAIGFFFVCIHIYLKSWFVTMIYKWFNFVNTMTDDFVKEKSKIK